MRKVVALFIAVMLCVPLFAVPSAFAAQGARLSVPYFSGKVLFNELTGKATKTGGISEVYAEDTVIKDSESDKVVRLDGVIESAEWGEPLLSLDSASAATLGSEGASADNTYFWHTQDGANGYKADAGLSLKVWMAWDESYLYIAALSDDPDGPRLDAANESIFNGDTLEIRIASGSITDKAMDLGAGYAAPNTTSGHVALFDMAERYYPHLDLATGSENGIVYEPYNVGFASAASGADGDSPFGTVYGAVRPVSSPTQDNSVRFLTSYEIAIPWHMIDGSYFDFDESENVSSLHISDKAPASGDEFSAALTLINAAFVGGNGEYNSYLTWSEATRPEQMECDPATSLGANVIVLSAGELGGSTSPVAGDVDGDGGVTVKDLKLINKYMLGLVGDSDIVFDNTDVDSDGSITTKDVKLISSLLLTE